MVVTLSEMKCRHLLEQIIRINYFKMIQHDLLFKSYMSYLRVSYHVQILYGWTGVLCSVFQDSMAKVETATAGITI